jgi:hypothetical protein
VWRLWVWLRAALDQYGEVRAFAWMFTVTVFTVVLIAILLFAKTFWGNGLLN